jgi:PAS domain S-box-containing protein
VTQSEALEREINAPAEIYAAAATSGEWSTDIEALRREIARLRAAKEEAVSAQQRLAFLCEASRELAASLDRATTLETIARVTVPVMGDLCVVLVAGEPEGHREIGAIRTLPSSERLMQQLLRAYLANPGVGSAGRGEGVLESPVTVAMRTGATLVVPNVTDAFLRSISSTADQLRLARELDLSSVLIVPLKVRERVLGVLALATTRYREPYSAEDVALAEELARRAASALENALLLLAEQKARAAAERAVEESAKLQREIEAERARLEVVLRRMPAGVAIIGSPSGKLLLANEHMERIFGVPSAPVEGLEGYRWYKGYHPDGRPYEPHEWPVARAIATGEETDGEEIVIERADGKPGVIWVSAAPIRDRDGQIQAGVVMFYEVTAQKEAERALRVSEERYRLAERASNAYLYVCNFEAGEITYSDGLTRFFGWDLAVVPNEYEASLAWWAEQIHPLERQRVGAAFRKAIASGAETWVDEYRFRRADGKYAWVLDRAAIARNERGEPTQVVGSVMDISDRRLVFETQRRLAALVEASQEGILSLSQNGIIESWNKGAARIFGYCAEEIVGHSVLILTPPARQAESRAIFERVVRGGNVSGLETVRRTKCGKDIEISLSVAPVLDAAGDFAGMSALVQDITERKRLRAQLALADRTASLGTLAAGVAHEVNNPIAYVVANLNRIVSGLEQLRSSALSPELAPAVASLSQAALDAKDGASRVAQIIRDLQSLSRGDEDTRRPVDLRSIVDIAVKMAGAQAHGRARIVKELGEVPLVEANEGLLVQVFINLVVNAAHAIPEGAVDRHAIRVITRTDEAGRAVAEVRDTGAGILPEIQERIFEPFFTTKPVGEGSGIGLAICRAIVSAHGGDIGVDSELGKGSVFRVTLPSVVGPRSAQEEAKVPPSVQGSQRRGRLLVIDDEVRLGKAIAHELSLEHEAEVVTSGEEALARFQRGDRFDVILCDLFMPAMPGMVLYEELRRIAPGQADRMIFLTGGAFTAGARKFLGEISNRSLEKPFDMDQLRSMVREVLGEPLSPAPPP